MRDLYNLHEFYNKGKNSKQLNNRRKSFGYQVLGFGSGGSVAFVYNDEGIFGYGDTNTRIGWSTADVASVKAGGVEGLIIDSRFGHTKVKISSTNSGWSTIVRNNLYCDSDISASGDYMKGNESSSVWISASMASEGFGSGGGSSTDKFQIATPAFVRISAAD